MENDNGPPLGGPLFHRREDASPYADSIVDKKGAKYYNKKDKIDNLKD
ncbi:MULTISPECIES: hypothetical protein [unclassified Flavonifractor]|nr:MULTISPECIES: hypothetical protein [unclassified Flavonifractor]